MVLSPRGAWLGAQDRRGATLLALEEPRSRPCSRPHSHPCSRPRSAWAPAALPRVRGWLGEEPNMELPRAARPPPRHGVPGIAQTRARHLRRSRLRRTRPGRQPCKRGGGVRACPVSPARGDRGEAGELGELLPAVQPVGEDCLSGQPEGTSRAGNTGSDKDRDVGTGRGHVHGQGMPQGWRSPGHDRCWEQPRGHRSPWLCLTPERLCVPGESISVKPSDTAAVTVGALGHRRVVSAWVTPRGSSLRGFAAPEARQVLGELQPVPEAREPGNADADGGRHAPCPGAAPPAARVLTRRRWGWVAAAAQPGRCCRQRVLVPVSVPLGRPRLSPWRGTGTPLLQERGHKRGLSAAAPDGARPGPSQPPQGIPCQSLPLSPEPAGDTAPQGRWGRGSGRGEAVHTGVREGERGRGLLIAQSSGGAGHGAEPTFWGGDLRRGPPRPDITCVELGAIDCSHHRVQLPACGQGEAVRPGAPAVQRSPHPRPGSEGPQLPSRHGRGAWGARGGGAASHTGPGVPLSRLPKGAEGVRCGSSAASRQRGSAGAGGFPRCSPGSPRAGPYRWCRGWQPSCSS